MKELLEQLDEDIQGCRRLARRNYKAAYLLYSAALISSVAATALSFTDTGSPLLRGCLSAFPGIAVLVNGSLKLQQKSRWYWDRIRRLQTLERQLKFEGKAAPEVSAAFSLINVEMERTWPTLEIVPMSVKDGA